MTPLLSMLAGAKAFGLTSFKNLFEPAGAFDAISTISVGSTSVGSITFSNIPQNYRHLQIRSVNFVDVASNPQIRFNGDSTNSYSWHHLYGNGTSIFNNGGSSQSFMYYTYNPQPAHPSTSIIDILDYSSPLKHKTMRTLSGSDAVGNTSEVALWSGSWQSLLPITSITLLQGNSNNFTNNSIFSLYGVK